MDTGHLNNAIKFYMLANNLRYIPVNCGSKQSVTEQVYGAMILATAINSEYKKVDNLGATLRIILFDAINNFYHKELISCFHDMNKGEKYAKEILTYLTLDKFNNQNSNECQFAYICKTFEHSMRFFFEVFLKKENITTKGLDELYQLAKNYGILDSFGNDEQKNYKIFRFYYLNWLLKNKIESTRNFEQQNISRDRVEKISGQVVGGIALAIGLNSEFNFNIDLNEIIFILCIHKISEIIVNDEQTRKTNFSQYCDKLDKQREISDSHVFTKILKNIKKTE